MEMLGEQRDLITKMSNFNTILNFYDYAYGSVQVLRQLCRKTRDLWINQQDVIARIFQKQIILIQKEPIDIYTIKMLKKNNRYKLFKLDISIDTQEQDRLKVFYQMLDELPEIEISSVQVDNCNNEFIDAVASKPMFKTKQDLYKVLEISDRSAAKQSKPHEYLSNVYDPEKHDMS